MEITMCFNLDLSFMDSVIEGFKVNASLCASVIALLMAMIGISLPLIINSTSKALSEYQNEYITQMFKEEKDYKYLKNVIPWHIGVCLVVFFLTDIINRNEWVAFVVSISIVIIAVVSIFRYIRYLKRFTEYAINTDKVVTTFVNGKLDSFIKEKTPECDAREIVDLYAKLLQKKARYGCDEDFYKTFKILSDYIRMLSAVVREHEEKNKDSDLWIKFSLIAAHYYRAYSGLMTILMKRDVEEMGFLHEKFKPVLVELFFSRPLTETGIPFDSIFRAYAFQVTNADILNDSKGLLKRFAWEWWFDLQKDERLDDINYMPLARHLFPILRILTVRGVSTSIISFVSRCVEEIAEFDDYQQQHEKDYEIMKNQSRLLKVETPATMNGFMQNMVLIESMKNTTTTMIQSVRRLFLRNQAYVEVIRVGAYCKFKHVDEVVDYIISIAEKFISIDVTQQLFMDVLHERHFEDNMREQNYVETKEVSKFLEELRLHTTMER